MNIKKSTFKKTLLTGLLWFNVGLGHCEQPLVFISAPDMHNIESFMQEPEPTTSPDFDFLLAGMAHFNPMFVLLPGDLGGQHWWEAQYQSICAPGGTLSDIILGCAAKTYPRLLNYMASHGLPPVYVVVGDHEIGDNNWPLGIRSNAVPYFKQAFAKYFTKNTDGSSRFNGTLGDVPLQPIGTPYENTAYAFQKANVLFVVVDQFRQDSLDQLVSKFGTVKATVDSDGQLQWLDRLLKAAKQQPSIRHIMVSGHLPVLSPVRGRASSMMYLDTQQHSAFWKLLRKYQVDVYLAGEVHQTTVIKDPESRILQIIHKGGCCKKDVSGFLVGRVYAERIEFDQQSLQINTDGSQSFVKEGTLVIDKTLGKFRYRASGTLLKPIDPKGLVVHYSFDEDISKVVKNYGSFGASYDATQLNINAMTSGALGNAVGFDDAQQSIVTSLDITPIAGQQPRTVSVWIRSSNHSEAYIYPSGKFTSPQGGFRLLLADGILKLQINAKTLLQANQGLVRLNDDTWHHVAVTFNRIGTPITDEVLFYIDGQQYGLVNTLTKTIFTETNTDNVMIGGRRKDQAIAGWTGALDDFAIWASALTSPMVKAVKTCGQALAYNASDMEALFKLYRKKSGSVVIKGLTWEYRATLSGTLGSCENILDSYSLRLNEDGQGVAVH